MGPNILMKGDNEAVQHFSNCQSFSPHFKVVLHSLITLSNCIFNVL